MKTYIYILFAFICCTTTAQETLKWSGSRPDGHAPISIMGDHTHGKGEFMVSYRSMYMNMEGLNRGSKNVPFTNALPPNDQYMVTPTQMQMTMHMLGVMYAPSDKITLMTMVNYIAQDMDHLTAMGGNFNTTSSGISDLKIGALYKIFNYKRQQLHAQIGISIPTGSIEQKGITPASAPNAMFLPYPMQNGSGTWDPELALTYLKQWNSISIGSQAKTTLRLQQNKLDYQLGNTYTWNNWVAVQASPWLSISGRFTMRALGKIKGNNPNLNPMMVITADTNNSGKTYAEAGIGCNLYTAKGKLKNLRFGFEAGLPLFQNMNGIQLNNKELIIAGVQYAF